MVEPKLYHVTMSTGETTEVWCSSYSFTVVKANIACIFFQNFDNAIGEGQVVAEFVNPAGVQLASSKLKPYIDESN